MFADSDAMDLLHELATLGMGVARRLSAAIEKAEDPQDLVALGGAFHQVGRGVRQSIALRLRIANGSFPGERPAERASAPAEVQRPERPEVERVDWNEYERPDWEQRPDDEWRSEPVEGEAEHFETGLSAGVVQIRSAYAHGHAVLERSGSPATSTRAALLNGSARLRLVDSS